MLHRQSAAGGIAVWDKHSTLHCAMAACCPHDRVNQRVTSDAHGTAAELASANQQVRRGVRLRCAAGSSIAQGEPVAVNRGWAHRESGRRFVYGNGPGHWPGANC